MTPFERDHRDSYDQQRLTLFDAAYTKRFREFYQVNAVEDRRFQKTKGDVLLIPVKGIRAPRLAIEEKSQVSDLAVNDVGEYVYRLPWSGILLEYLHRADNGREWPGWMATAPTRSTPDFYAFLVMRCKTVHLLRGEALRDLFDRMFEEWLGQAMHDMEHHASRRFSDPSLFRHSVTRPEKNAGYRAFNIVVPLAVLRKHLSRADFKTYRLDDNAEECR